MNTIPANPQKLPVIYILSPSFSGSTLLTLLLAQHEQIATIGELKATAMGDVNEYVCSCGTKMVACEFWQGLQNRLHQDGLDFDFGDFGTHFTASNAFFAKVLGAQYRGKLFETVRETILSLTPGLGAQFRQLLDRNYLFMRHITELQEKQFFLDGSKDVHRLAYLLGDPRYDIFVIDLVRDGRAQSHSRRANDRRIPADFKEAVIEWRDTIEQMQRIKSRVPADRLYSLSYEMLCETPDKYLKELCDFLNISPMYLDWSAIDLKKTEHHILGNRMRTKDTISVNLDEKWKRELTSEEIQLFEQIAGRLNHELAKKFGRPI